MVLGEYTPGLCTIVIIRVQVEGVRGYSEDQVAIVEPGSTIFGSLVPVILGNPTINRIINVIKESEIYRLSASLNGLSIAWLLTCHQAELPVKSDATASPTVDPTNVNVKWPRQPRGKTYTLFYPR